MEKVMFDIVEKGPVCEFKKDSNQPGITDDCEKLLYLALAEGKNQPTQIQIKNEDGSVRKTIFVPEQLHLEELNKRDELLQKVGLFLTEVIGLPEEISNRFSQYNSIDELYDYLIQLLEYSGWGLVPKQAEKKFNRGDEIQKRDNIIYLTADLLQFNNLAPPQVLADFYNYPSKVTIDQLINNIQWMIDQNKNEVLVIYVIDHPVKDELQTDLVPIFIEEQGHLKIVNWISQDTIPQNLVPVFDIEQNLIGWLDANNDLENNNPM